MAEVPWYLPPGLDKSVMIIDDMFLVYKAHLVLPAHRKP